MTLWDTKMNPCYTWFQVCMLKIQNSKLLNLDRLNKLIYLSYKRAYLNSYKNLNLTQSILWKVVKKKQKRVIYNWNLILFFYLNIQTASTSLFFGRLVRPPSSNFNSPNWCVNLFGQRLIDNHFGATKYGRFVGEKSEKTQSLVIKRMMLLVSSDKR